MLEIRTGARLDQSGISSFLAANGYSRTDIVDEPGEYAVRGGILDLFPAGSEEPLRLDFFGDEIDRFAVSIRLPQRSGERIDALLLKPVSELVLDAAAIERFRTGYRELFGAVTGEDPLYEAVSAGRLYAGMGSIGLPLFYARLETLFDYLPGIALTLDDQAEAARLARLDTVKDFYEGAPRPAPRRSPGGAPVYNPLPPDRLYLTEAEWQGLLRGRTVAAFSPFAASEISGSEHTMDAGGKRSRDFAEICTQPGQNLFEAVRDRIAGELGQKRHVLVAGYSAGSLERFGESPSRARIGTAAARHRLGRSRPIAPGCPGVGRPATGAWL